MTRDGSPDLVAVNDRVYQLTIHHGALTLAARVDEEGLLVFHAVDAQAIVVLPKAANSVAIARRLPRKTK